MLSGSSAHFPGASIASHDRAVLMTSNLKLQARQTATGANPVKSPNAGIVRTATAPSEVPVEWAMESAPSTPGPASSSAASSLRGPTAEQLASLTHLPAAGRTGQRRRKSGKLVAKVFNPQASRPVPLLSTPYQEFQATLLVDYNDFATSITVPTYSSSYFALSSFPAYTAYTALFDEYKFVAIELWVEPSLLMSSTVASVEMATCVDIDDANTPASFSDVSDRQGAITSLTGTGHYHRWKPSVAVAMYSGAFTSFGNEPAPWIDCASAGVQHYGFKFATAGADGVARTHHLMVRATIRFRGPAV